MAQMGYNGKYRLASCRDLDTILIRVSLERRSTAFDFGRVASPAILPEETETVELKWQQLIEQTYPEDSLSPPLQTSETTLTPRGYPSRRRIFTVTQDAIARRAFELPEPVNVRHESFLAKRHRNLIHNLNQRKDQQIRQKAGPPNLIVNGNSERFSEFSKSSQRMLIVAFLGRNHLSTLAKPGDSSSLESLNSCACAIIADLRLTQDTSGYLLSISPDFSTEPFTIRVAESEDSYLLHLNLIRDDPLRPTTLPRPSIDARHDGQQQQQQPVTFVPSQCELNKRRAQMVLAQPKENQLRFAAFGEIEYATGLPRGKAVFVMYTVSCPRGWKLLGSRQEDELNATFSSVSVSRRNPYTGISNTVASFGYPFHFNFIVNSRDQNNCVPNLHFKVVHFDQETSRFSNLGEGKCALHNSHGTVRVALIRRLPATFIGQLRERFLGGDPFLKGIVLNQNYPRDCFTEPAGYLLVRFQILRQSRQFRLEDLVQDSRRRLLKSSGQTLSTVQNALSAFQEARNRMIQIRQEERGLVDSAATQSPRRTFNVKEEEEDK